MNEWDREPDHLEFESHGLRALVLRNPTFGHLNGYLAIPNTHVLWGIDDVLAEISSHKGWSYASACHPHTNEEDGYWWIGFDCAHGGDFLPNEPDYLKVLQLKPSPRPRRKVYRNLSYVRGVLEEAAFQVSTYMGPNIVMFGGKPR